MIYILFALKQNWKHLQNALIINIYYGMSTQTLILELIFYVSSKNIIAIVCIVLLFLLTYADKYFLQCRKNLLVNYYFFKGIVLDCQQYYK